MRFIYLHGFASGPASKQATYFRERFRERGVHLEIPDLAAADFERLTLTRQLAVIEEAAGNGPLVLLGSSMGGYLAALYAARHAEVSRVVLLAPAFGFARRWPATLGEERLNEWRRSGWIPVYHYGDGRERRVSYDLLDDGLRYEDFPALTQPALIFHGRRDEVVPAAFAEEFAAGRPNVRLEILESDHELVDQLPYMWRETAVFLDLTL